MEFLPVKPHELAGSTKAVASTSNDLASSDDAHRPIASSNGWAAGENPYGPSALSC
jgi:hypothetical protein